MPQIKSKFLSRFLCIVLFLSFCSTIKAETPVLRSQLVGKWRLIDENYKDCVNTWEFTEDTMKQTWKYKFIDNPSIYSRQYYLFDGIPSKYDPSLVGQTESGTHIIYYSEKLKRIKYYEVVILKNDTLTLRTYTEKTIGRLAGYVTLTFKRISE